MPDLSVTVAPTLLNVSVNPSVSLLETLVAGVGGGGNGISPTLSVSSTVGTVPYGTPGSASLSGTTSNPILSLTLPAGASGSNGSNGTNGTNGINGISPTLSVSSTVGTVPSGTAGSAALSGTSSNPVLSLTLPAGPQGPAGTNGTNGTNGSAGTAATVSVGTTTTGAPGSSASVTNSGTTSAAVLNFTVPGSAALSNIAPSALAASASVGTSTLAARADHIHAAPPASLISGLGTSSTKDVPASGDASSTQVVLGSDSRLSPLVFTTNSNTRTLTGYKESGATQTVRTAAITSGVLTLTLATFTPSFPTSGNYATPSNSPNWDDSITGFTVQVTNPSDVTSQWIKAVSSISGATGALSGFTAGTQSPSAASSSVSWTQPFAVNTSKILSSGSGTSGGSTTITVYFQDNNSTTDSVNWKATFTVSWASVSNSLSVNGLSGNTFLQTYASTGYSVGTSGLTTSSNASHTVTASGGTASSSTGSGTLTFTSPIHKSTPTIPSVSLSTTFTRPSGVTGTGYTTSAVTKGPTSPSVSFSYPSFSLFTASGSTPTAGSIVNGTAYGSGVTSLGDGQKTFSGTVNNSSSNPQTFWFGVRSSASQPSSFQTGSSASLLSPVSYSKPTGGIDLQPTLAPSGYSAENFTIYGIVLQPGNTYVSIS